MLELFEGRPESDENRTEKEIKVYDLLDRLNIRYQRVDHEKADTMEACREIDEVLQCTVCKNLFLCNHQQTKFYLLLMPPEKKFRTKDLSKQIGSSRLSFAPDDKMLEYLNVTPGSVSIFGLMNDTDNHVQLLADEDILQGEEIGFHPCINTSSLKLSVKDVFEVFLPAVKHNFIKVHL
jgi:Ala-tRNA(Pro) deacylase